jgi:hypothetical protein
MKASTSFAICIASHGDPEWGDLARERALPSAITQGCPVFIEHDHNETRAQVRNRLAHQSLADYLVFLDADDELEPGFIEAMREAADGESLLVPAISYVVGGEVQEPMFWPEAKDLRNDNNWMVVGTGVPRDLFFEVGGWRTLTGTGMLNEYDDWDLWLRCQLAGAQPVKVPDAVYVAHVAPDSTHRTARPRQKQAWRREIQLANFPGARR